jgi:hypothetical protein
MTDDIVTRLRERALILFQNGADGNAFIDEHAADEIERLRADRDRYRLLADYLCQNAPSVIVPDEISCLFPDPLPAHND